MGFNKENSVMVSVIMSVYNAEKYLDLAIESILNQSFRDFEFIIIEDCSTDGSLKIYGTYLVICDFSGKISTVYSGKNTVLL